MRQSLEVNWIPTFKWTTELFGWVEKKIILESTWDILITYQESSPGTTSYSCPQIHLWKLDCYIQICWRILLFKKNLAENAVFLENCHKKLKFVLRNYCGWNCKKLDELEKFL